MYMGLHVKYRYCCQILRTLECSPQIFRKYSEVRFDENPFSRSRFVPWGETDGRTDRRDETNGLFRNFADAPKTNPWKTDGRLSSLHFLPLRERRSCPFNRPVSKCCTVKYINTVCGEKGAEFGGAGGTYSYLKIKWLIMWSGLYARVAEGRNL
jgi:hypothetical protein